MDRWRGKVAIVTGASVGIGAAIANKLVEEGLLVVGFARRVEKIEENATKLSGKAGKLYARQCDMTKEEDIVNGIKWTIDNVGPIHILVNNAGVLVPKTLLDGDGSGWKTTFDTNVVGLCIATREAVRNMMDNKVDGHIVHINSIAGHRIGKAGNVYSASKFAVTNLTEVLRQDLNEVKSKIKISSVSPGLVETDIINNIRVPKDVLDSLPKLKCEDIADAVAYVLSTPPLIQIHELTILPVNQP